VSRVTEGVDQDVRVRGIDDDGIGNDLPGSLTGPW
jgi:hypothetical protein